MQTFHEEQRSCVLGRLEVERWRRGGASREELLPLHPALAGALGVATIAWREGEQVEELLVQSSSGTSENGEAGESGESSGEAHTFADAVIPLLTAASAYLALGDSLPHARLEVGLKLAELLKLFNSRTCQLVLGAGAVNLAGLKTITIRCTGVVIATSTSTSTSSTTTTLIATSTTINISTLITSTTTSTSTTITTTSTSTSTSTSPTLI